MGSVARWAGRGAFVEGLLRPALRGLLVMVGLIIAYILCVVAYYSVPWSWYDHTIIDQLRSAAPTPSGGEPSEEAAKIFPSGMERNEAQALLRRNGFSCVSMTPNRLKCTRTISEFVCRSDYFIELTLNDDQRVANQNASYHSACL
jgi:hypothetical protein